jgi:hypothetical protein
MSARSWMGLALVIALGGCSDDGKFITGPEAFVWQPDDIPPKFSVKAKPEMKGTFSDYRASLKVTVWNFPKGLVLQLGDAQSVVEENEYHSASVTTNVKALYGKLPAIVLEQAADLGGERPMLNHGLSLVITPKGRPPVSLPLPPVRLFDGSITDLFEDVAEQKGVVFGSEPKKAPEKHKSVIAVSPFVRGVFGSAVTLGDIDAVAVTKTLPDVKGTKVCGGFADSSGRPMPAVTIQLKEAEVTLYDRRTGVELEKRRFAPNEECPRTVLLRGDSKTDDSTPAKEPIIAWLKARVAQ